MVDLVWYRFAMPSALGIDCHSRPVGHPQEAVIVIHWLPPFTLLSPSHSLHARGYAVMYTYRCGLCWTPWVDAGR